MARGGDVCNDGDGVLVRLTGDDGGFLPRWLVTARRWRALTAPTAPRFTGTGFLRISPFAT
ncbi:hypothetical protein UA44_22500, partial [Klebsiella aerogenes]